MRLPFWRCFFDASAVIGRRFFWCWTWWRHFAALPFVVGVFTMFFWRHCCFCLWLKPPETCGAPLLWWPLFVLTLFSGYLFDDVALKSLLPFVLMFVLLVGTVPCPVCCRCGFAFLATMLLLIPLLLLFWFDAILLGRSGALLCYCCGDLFFQRCCFDSAAAFVSVWFRCRNASFRYGIGSAGATRCALVSELFRSAWNMASGNSRISWQVRLFYLFFNFFFQIYFILFYFILFFIIIFFLYFNVI